MSMLSCRVLCFLAIVLCCVGVAHANAATPRVSKHVNEEVLKPVEKTKQLKAECENATNAAKEVADEAQRFVNTTLKELETIATNPEEVEKTKSEGQKLIEKARKAEREAEKVAEQTTNSIKASEDIVGVLRDINEYPDTVVAAQKVIEDAFLAVDVAYEHADKARMCGVEVRIVLQKLEAAVAAAKEKKEEKQVESQAQEHTNKTSLDEQQSHTEGNKTEQTQETQVETQPQEQTNETSLGEQQGHTEGNQAEQTQEKQVEPQPQPQEQTNETSLGEQQGHTEGNKTEETQERQEHPSRSNATINIHGDNLGPLLNGGANNSGMALNDGSSSPALLRVPLLLLLLLSVLGCMAVC
ncbi:uncharacterized protein TM35_000771100 [Trypanosoma theileri]|uniref:Uncharacterized protein n=1 Tax=Trypanosoma theileri TaxID=67003 RepID=A0A1X0NGW1_9TRYP|nr:uncharacterized protein TM35_000771100 [Trypanosoma theileri]ORC83148.1 hypothetical protein TM35_000771100 [Trypanosoma theileri]